MMDVEVFDLDNHPKASRVYAWAHETDDADRPSVTSGSQIFRL